MTDQQQILGTNDASHWSIFKDRFSNDRVFL